MEKQHKGCNTKACGFEKVAVAVPETHTASSVGISVKPRVVTNFYIVVLEKQQLNLQ
jgi:hypothetical protein